MAYRKKKRSVKEDRGFYEPYAVFSRTLRAWLVAYGIGASVFFSTHQSFARVLAQSNEARPIIGFFLFGVSVQVAAALIYKYSMGYIYFGELDKGFQKTKRYRMSEYLSQAMWLEMLFDVLSIGVFIGATYLALKQYILLSGN
jgi:hypothetical protein